MKLQSILINRGNLFSNLQDITETRPLTRPYPVSRSSVEKMTGNILSESGIGMWLIMIGEAQINLCNTAKELISARCSTNSIFSILRSVAPEDARDLLNAITDTCRNKARMSTEVRLSSSLSNGTRWLKIKGWYIHGNKEHDGIIRGTIVDITEEKLEELRKEDYISLMNHELRSPLTTIKLYIQMAIKHAKTDDEIRTANILKKAEGQTNAMSRMIENFLTTSLLSNAKMRIVPETFEMLDLLHEVIQEIGNQNPNRHFEIGFSSDTIVYADRDKISQVLVNYLSNAVKYSQGGTIRISCMVSAKSIGVSVSDQGEGISTVNQKKIFSRFYRTNPAGRTKGFGLGLFLVKEIIECHGGTVWLESKVGEGSTFYFNLPMSTELAPN